MSPMNDVARFDATMLRIDAMNILIEWKACNLMLSNTLLNCLVGETYSDAEWTDDELNIYQALVGPHGRTVFKALVIKRGINLDNYK